jgi:hypothetical protein
MLTEIGDDNTERNGLSFWFLLNVIVQRKGWAELIKNLNRASSAIEANKTLSDIEIWFEKSELRLIQSINILRHNSSRILKDVESSMPLISRISFRFVFLGISEQSKPHPTSNKMRDYVILNKSRSADLLPSSSNPEQWDILSDFHWMFYMLFVMFMTFIVLSKIIWNLFENPHLEIQLHNEDNSKS